MAHELDFTTGKAAMAYVGKTPWHGLGEQLPEGASIQEWQRAAGLEWTAERSPIIYRAKHSEGSSLRVSAERFALYRSDTADLLGVVSDRYVPVQPAEVLGFFRTLVEDVGGYSIETAGALFQGRRVWALARLGEAAEVTEGDRVAPYLMLATSFDGSLATVAQFTTVRVVCNNTLSLSLSSGAAKGEQVRLKHSAKFDASELRGRLGILGQTWAGFIETTRRLAAEPLTTGDAADFLVDLFEPADADKFTDSRNFRQMMDGFTAQNIGHDGQRTRWQMLNTVTELVDWKRGRSQDTRLQSAWFGDGAALKSRALDLLAA